VTIQVEPRPGVSVVLPCLDEREAVGTALGLHPPPLSSVFDRHRHVLASFALRRAAAGAP
jgi:hypothetical protein